MPSTRRDPPATGVSPAIARPIVVFPEPLSPTSPSTSPGAIVKLTRSTARKAARRKRPGYSMISSSATTTSAVSTADGGELPVGDLEARNRGEQPLRVVVLRRGEEIPGGGRLDDLALEHHCDAIGEIGDHAHVVGDEDDRGSVLVAQVAQQFEDLGLDRHVEGGGRLVGDDHRRVQRQRHRDHDALLLPAGELVRVVVDPALGFRDADTPQHLDGARLRLALGVLPVRPQALGQLPAHRVHRVERRGRLLEDHGGFGAAHLAQFLLAERDDFGAVEDDSTLHHGGLGQQPEDRARRHRLAAAGLAHDREHLTAAHVQRHSAHGVDVRHRPWRTSR